MVSRGLTFSLDVRSQGAESLRRLVIEKISQFTGASRDETLADYVVVLVGLGKHQEQAVKDLEAFLGDQSEAFVTWLWDHLCLNIHLYTSKSPETKGAVVSTALQRSKSGQELNEDISDTNVGSPEEGNCAHMSSVTNQERPIGLKKDILLMKERIARTFKDARVRHAVDLGQGSIRLLKRALAFDLQTQTQEQPSHKKRLKSPLRENAARRLLQSAVRDAIIPTTGQCKRPKSSLKRARLASADMEDLEDSTFQEPSKGAPPQNSGVRSVKRFMPAMMMAMKAAADAAKDANNSKGRRHSGSILDRLGKDSNQAAHEHVRSDHEGREILEIDVRSDCDYELKSRKKVRSTEKHITDECNEESSDERLCIGKRYQMVERLDDDGDAIVGSTRYEECRESVSETIKWSEDKSAMEHEPYQRIQDVSKDVKDNLLVSCLSEPSSSQKVVNTLANVSAWKPKEHQNVDKAACEQPNRSSLFQDLVGKMEVGNTVSLPAAVEGIQNDQMLTTSKKASEVQMEKPAVASNVPKSTLPAISGLKQPRSFQDDTEIRTVYVSNLDSTATKEALTNHFQPCGDVARIIMVTDGVTGQFKGSAYIEFKSVDAAERALTLNDSLFMSRPLKVVSKDSMRRPTPLGFVGRSRFLQPVPPHYVICAYSNMHVRPPTSFPRQWTREPGFPSASRPTFGVPSRRARSLTYVRNSESPLPGPGLNVIPTAGLVHQSQQSAQNGADSDPVKHGISGHDSGTNTGSGSTS